MDMKGPISVKIVSILCLIYGALGILIALFSLIQIFHPLYSDAASIKLGQDPTIIKVGLSTAVARFLLSTFLLVSAIGGLKLKRWGRAGLNAFAVLYVLEMLVFAFLQSIFMLPKTLEALKDQPNMTDQALRVVGIMSIVVAVLSVLWALAISLTILITFNRKPAVDAFHGIFPEEPIQNDPPLGGTV
jgi:uncharacterized protein YjeT (DUF2065 family)